MPYVIFMHLSEFRNPLYTYYVIYHVRIWKGGGESGPSLGKVEFFEITK